MSFKGAIFDLDGTLIDSMEMWEKIEKDYIESLGVKLDDEMVNDLNTMSIVQAGNYISEKFNVDLDIKKMYREICETMIKFYSKDVALKPGVKNFLEMLRENGVKMCIATASDRNIVEPTLKRLGIFEHFEFIITCTEVGKGKESSDIFEKSLEMLRTNKENTYVFEDSLVAISTAKKCGFKVVGINDIVSLINKKSIMELSDIYVESTEKLTEIFEKIR